MSREPVEYDRSCPDCGSLVRHDAVQCWLCHAALGKPAQESGEEEVNPYQSTFDPGERRSPLGTSTLLFGIVFVIVWIGVAAMAPGLAVVLLILLGPALLRLVIVSERRAHRGERYTLGEKFLTVLATLGMTLGVILAGVIALAVMCAALMSGMRFH